MTKDIGGRTARGAFWVAAGETGKTLASGLAVFLGPLLLGTYEYGTAAAVLVVLGAVDALSQAGFREAIIQRESVDDVSLDTAWTLLFGRGLLLAAGMFLAAPAIGGFFPDAPDELVPMLQVASCVLLFSNLHSAGVLEHTRELRFKRLVPMSVVPPMLQTALILGLLLVEPSPWAFVWGRVAFAASEMVLSYVVAPRRPRWRLDIAVALDLARFGRWILLVTAVGFAILNLDNLLVGRWLGMGALAIYKTAYDLSQLPVSRLTHVVGRAAMPAYARLQGDLVAIRTLFGQVVRASSLMTLPATAAVAVFVPDLVAAFKPGYEELVLVCWILCLSVPIRMISAFAGILFRALGQPRIDFEMNVWRLLVLALGIAPVLRTWGLPGLCWLVLAAIAATWPNAWRGLRRLAQIEPRLVAEAVAPSVYVAAVFGGAAWLIRAQLPAGLAWAVVAGILALLAIALGALLPRLVGLWDPLADARQLRAALRPTPTP